MDPSRVKSAAIEAFQSQLIERKFLIRLFLAIASSGYRAIQNESEPNEAYFVMSTRLPAPGGELEWFGPQKQGVVRWY